jgi:glycosyltransferase involved in cell wall biosynthesis
VLILHDCLYISNIAAYLFARVRGIPVIVIQHIGLVPYRNPILRGIMALANRIIARPMLASASQVVFISENTRDYFRSVRFSKPAVTVFNGVNCETFRPLRESEPKAEVRAQFGLPADATVALFVGRFVPKKGLNILREMATREPGIIWAFAGSGQLDPAGWGLDNVRVYSNLRNHGLADLYRACDILVLPSTGEGFPLVLQEALASGLPVVCGDHAAAADPILNAYLRGIAVVAGDDQLSASRFLAAVREVLSPSHDTRAAQRRYEFARSRYSWQVALRRYREIAAALADTATQPAAAARKARSAFAAAGESPRGGA